MVEDRAASAIDVCALAANLDCAVAVLDALIDIEAFVLRIVGGVTGFDATLALRDLDLAGELQLAVARAFDAVGFELNVLGQRRGRFDLAALLVAAVASVFGAGHLGASWAAGSEAFAGSAAYAVLDSDGPASTAAIAIERLVRGVAVRCIGGRL